MKSANIFAAGLLSLLSFTVAAQTTSLELRSGIAERMRRLSAENCKNPAQQTGTVLEQRRLENAILLVARRDSGRIGYALVQGEFAQEIAGRVGERTCLFLEDEPPTVTGYPKQDVPPAPIRPPQTIADGGMEKPAAIRRTMGVNGALPPTLGVNGAPLHRPADY